MVKNKFDALDTPFDGKKYQTLSDIAYFINDRNHDIVRTKDGVRMNTNTPK